MAEPTVWEVWHHGRAVAARPSREAARAYVRDEAEQECGGLVDALAWHPAGDGEALWLRAGGAETESGWAIRPASAGGDPDGR